jgi:hypothetical protein
MESNISIVPYIYKNNDIIIALTTRHNLEQKTIHSSALKITIFRP